MRHKWFVARECFRHGLYWQGITHDLSKFLPDEWFTYVNQYYGDNKSPDHIQKFRVAFLTHQKRNKHHWQYWLLFDDFGNFYSLPMPHKYVAEMLADWEGAGRAQGRFPNNDDYYQWTKKWYDKYKDEIFLDDEARNWIEKKLGLI